jgi:thiosulfate reductase cytochrome b subunit
MADEGVKIVERHWIYRHSVAVRVTHWLNAAILLALLMSGLQIFNAHPALYWGQASVFDAPWVAITSTEGERDDDPQRGVTTISGHSFETTGVLGLSNAAGQPQERAFPSWATIPSEQNLASGRRCHFLFAWLLVINGVIYLASGLLSRHITHDLAPTGPDLRHLPRSIWDHLRFRFPEGDEARRYNVLQKLTYLMVIFVILPVLILAGLTMSPGLDTAFPWLLDLFGGRQSARTIHFLCAFALVLFTIVHLVEVLISGFINNMRSMITGRYDIERRVRNVPTSSQS